MINLLSFFLHNFLIPVMWVMLVDGAAFVIGHAIYRRIVPETKWLKVEFICWPLLLGFIPLGMLAFVLGALQCLYTVLLVVIILSIFAWGGFRFYRQKYDFPQNKEEWDPILLVSLSFLFLYLLPCFFPSFHHDTLVYHLTIPKVYLENHGIVEQPYNLFFNMPHAVDLLYVWPMALGGHVTVNLFAYQFNWILIGGFILFAQRFAMPRMAGIFALLYVSNPELQWHFSSSLIEPALACYLLFAHLLFLDWLRDRRFSLLILCGLLVGWLMSAKYTVWYFVIGLGLSIIAGVYWHYKNERLSKRDLVWFLFAWIAPISLWLGKNWVMTGNPVYPVLFHSLGGRWWTVMQDMQFQRAFANNHLWVYEPDWLWTPWYWLKRTGELLYFNIIFGQPFSLALIGVYILALLNPFSYRKPYRLLLLWSLLALIGWRISPSLQIRFLVTVLPLGILPIASFYPLIQRRPFVYWIFNGLLCIFFFVQSSVYKLPSDLWKPYKYPQVQRETFWYYMWEEMGRFLTPSSKIFCFFENRIYFSKWDCFVDSAYESPASMEILRSAGSLEAAARRLADEGVSHVIVNWINVKMYYLERNINDTFFWTQDRAQDEISMLEKFLSQECEKAFDMDSVDLYRLRLQPQVAARDIHEATPMTFHGTGIHIQWPEIIRANRLELWIDWNDDYELLYMKKGAPIIRQSLPALISQAPPNARSESIPVLRIVKVPEEAGTGFDSLEIIPIAGDGHYSIHSIATKEAESPPS